MLETPSGTPRAMEGQMAASEEAVRYSKASLSVEAAFAAEGFGSPPSGLAAMVTAYVTQQTRGIPAGKMASMAPGSGEFAIAAAAGVNAAIGSLTPDQRAVMRAGGNPVSPADMAVIGAKLGLAGYVGYGQPSLGGNNGGRFGSMKEASGMDQAASAFARQIGADPAFAKLFSGASAEGLNAIAEFIRNGKPASDDDIHTIKDARAWIGAIRAGKIDPNDPNLPPAIKKIIAGMREAGIDPATGKPEEIKAWFDKNPDALRKAKASADNLIEKEKGLTEGRKADEMLKIAAVVEKKNAIPNASKPEAKDKPEAKEKKDAKADGSTSTAQAPKTVKLGF
jgi:hypothetical protein